MAQPVVSYAALAREPHIGETLELPFATACVSAGFPSPAEDYLENALDISAYLVKRPKATSFMRVTGDSMIGDGINVGDLIVIDRAEQIALYALVCIVNSDGRSPGKKAAEFSGNGDFRREAR
jgi:SOS-response transcriptional repressor LexA